METYDRYVDQHREVFIEELRAFCTQPSIAATGEGIPEMAKLVRAKMVELGADVQMLESVLEPDDPAASSRGVLRRIAAVFPEPVPPSPLLGPGQTFRLPAGSAYERLVLDGRPTFLTDADIPVLFPAAAGPLPLTAR